MFLYPEPHQFLGQVDSSKAFHDIIRSSQRSEHIIAIWRLCRFDQNSIIKWQHDPSLDFSLHNELPPSPDCLEAALTLKWMELNPVVLEGYLELEFISQTYGSRLDTRYVDRLQSAIDANMLHYHWRQLTTPTNVSSEIFQLHEDLDLRRMQLDLAYEEMSYLNQAMQEALAEAAKLKKVFSWEAEKVKILANLLRHQYSLTKRMIRILARLVSRNDVRDRKLGRLPIKRTLKSRS